MCFIGGERLLLQLDDALLLLDLDSGEPVWRGSSTAYVLHGAVGQRVLFGDLYGRSDWDGKLAGAAVLDLSTGRWLREYASDLPAVYVEKDQPEDAWLCDWHRRRIAGVEEDTSGDRPQEITRTPDHRFIWVSSCAGHPPALQYPRVGNRDAPADPAAGLDAAGPQAGAVPELAVPACSLDPPRSTPVG